MILFRLFYEFFKVGLFSVGGGLATIPFLYDLSDKTGWFTYNQLADMIAVSESTPGPIGVNMATYVGFLTDGVFGAVTATLGLITPSIIVILIIAEFLNNFGENKFVKAAFYGLRAASVALISTAGLTVAKNVFILGGNTFTSFVDFKAIVLAAVLIVLTRWFKPTKKLHPICFILFSAVIGIAFKFAGA